LKVARWREAIPKIQRAPCSRAEIRGCVKIQSLFIFREHKMLSNALHIIEKTVTIAQNF
jgi:hypothetical protein